MNLIAIMPVRNEEWVLGFSARVALMWCDMLICLNHRSVDNTSEILWDLARQTNSVLVMHSDDEDWREMEHRQRLLTIARSYDASHIALIDADEVLCGDSLPHIRHRIETLPAGYCLNVRMHCMWRGLHQYRTDPRSVWSNRRDLALAFADRPQMEFAAAFDGYQHHARAPRHSRPTQADDIGVMHLQFADWRRLTAKHALYKVRERLQYPDRPVLKIESMYNLALDEDRIQVTGTPDAWLAPYAGLTKYFNLHADEPWQEREVKRLVHEHGRQKFAGLNLFGVV